jgi:hypothetical protein
MFSLNLFSERKKVLSRWKQFPKSGLGHVFVTRTSIPLMDNIQIIDLDCLKIMTTTQSQIITVNT